MAYKIYGSGLSPFVRKVRVVMAEKGLPYDIDQINPFAPPPEFLAISPLKRIPVLRDTDRGEPNTLADSSIIADYLEHKHPKPALYPSDPYLRASALWFEEYADTAIAQCIGPGLFLERVVKKFQRLKTDEAVCQATLTEELPPLLGYLEAQLGSKEWFVGDAFSIADISVATMFVNFKHSGESVDAGRWPKLAAFVKRAHARPSFRLPIEEETPLVESVRAA
jgi:glutathione S-transferase